MNYSVYVFGSPSYPHADNREMYSGGGFISPLIGENYLSNVNFILFCIAYILFSIQNYFNGFKVCNIIPFIQF